jgi:ssDNA-binding replication factor A large subunit
MQIKDLTPKMGKIDIVADVVEKSEPRSFEKFGKQGKVCDAKLKDETGEVKLTLCNEQVDQINVGDRVHVQNGWADEFRGTLQLSAGKFGTLEVVAKTDAAAPEATPSASPVTTETPSEPTHTPEAPAAPEFEELEISEEEM